MYGFALMEGGCLDGLRMFKGQCSEVHIFHTWILGVLSVAQPSVQLSWCLRP